MEIKHTIEILTKDIQDIEKLVRNLNNYKTPPQIEIDLAKSKLRNVYDLLSIISKDIESDHLAVQSPAGHQAAPAQEPQQQGTGTPEVPRSQSLFETPVQEPLSEKGGNGAMQTPVKDPATTQEQTPHQDESPLPEQAPQQEQAQQQEQAPQQEQPPKQEQAPQQQQSAPQKQEPANEEVARQDPASTQEQTPQQEKPAPQQQKSEKPEAPTAPEQKPPQSTEESKEASAGTEPEHKKKEELKKASILAEQFASDRSLNEKIAPGSGNDLSSKLTGEPIDSIKRNIGINDRFLIIRELMEGNNEAFNKLVQQLDTQHNFDEAYHIIQSSFPDQMEHEGVNLLVRLSRRRYLGR